jgi:hypothetical protein
MEYNADMADDSQPSKARSRWQRFGAWAGGLALILGLVLAAFVISGIEPVSELCARIDAVRAARPGTIAIPIALMIAGGILMLGAQLLPAPRRSTPLSDEMLDAAAVPMEYAEQRGRLSRSIEMEATTEEVRAAWRRRSWQSSQRWRTFFLMMLGGGLVAVGVTSLFILIGPPFIKVLMVGLAAYAVVRIAWEFSVK